MRLSPSRRAILATVTLLLLVTIAAVVLLVSRDPGYYIPVDELVNDPSHLGDEVLFGGTVVSWNSDSIVLRPEYSESPTLTVELREPYDGSVGPGIVVVGKGVLSDPSRIVSAEVIAPSGPTRFEQNAGE